MDNMTNANLFAGWIGILMGFLAGAVQGLLFHKENWLGGYSSWPRRMVRLGHISFFGISFINLSFAFSVSAAGLQSTDSLAVVSWLFIVGAITMPLCCYASALRKGFRHLFFIPVMSLVTGAALFLFKGLLQ